MELQEFITRTLVDIKNGVSEANKELAKGGSTSIYYVINPTDSKSIISFDVAITVTKESSKADGGKIRIAVASIGREHKNIGTEENISRIKFSVSADIIIG